jgi:hypothetical protein
MSAATAHDAFDVLRGAGASHPEQTFFGLWRGDAGQGTDLGVREFATGQGFRQARQCGERAGDAHLLARGTHVEAHAPAQPVSAGAKAVAPSPSRIEVADEL